MNFHASIWNFNPFSVFQSKFNEKHPNLKNYKFILIEGFKEDAKAGFSATFVNNPISSSLHPSYSSTFSAGIHSALTKAIRNNKNKFTDSLSAAKNFRNNDY